MLKKKKSHILQVFVGIVLKETLDSQFAHFSFLIVQLRLTLAVFGAIRLPDLKVTFRAFRVACTSAVIQGLSLA